MKEIKVISGEKKQVEACPAFGDWKTKLILPWFGSHTTRENKLQVDTDPGLKTKPHKC